VFQLRDRVRHREFGAGTILKMDTTAGEDGSALVEWDSHRVTRVTPGLTQSQSHVSLRTLSQITGEVDRASTSSAPEAPDDTRG